MFRQSRTISKISLTIPFGGPTEDDRSYGIINDGAFCPMIAEGCKGPVCCSWRDGSCMIFAYLERRAYPPPRAREQPGEAPLETNGDSPPDEQGSTPPDILEQLSAEDIGKELYEFAKASAAPNQNVYVRQWSRSFWLDKGVDVYPSSAHAQNKMVKAEAIADQLAKDEYRSRLQKQQDDERARIPTLIDAVAAWAKAKGFKKITYSDLDAAIFEEKMEVSYHARRSVYSGVNVVLRGQ